MAEFDQNYYWAWEHTTFDSNKNGFNNYIFHNKAKVACVMPFHEKTEGNYPVPNFRPVAILQSHSIHILQPKFSIHLL